jgi:hypothetical protein
MDRGDFAAASGVIADARVATAALCASMPADAEALEECDDLALLSSSLADRGQDKMNRKKLSYGSLLRRMGRKRS